MKLYHTVAGIGPDLVLLHGWGMHSGIMDSIAARYQQRFRVHSIDLPGHGRSRDGSSNFTLEQVRTALTAVMPKNAQLLGWSLGGLLGMSIALDAPTHVAKLILLCSSPQFFSDQHWPHGMSPALLSGFADELLKDYRGTVLRFLGLCTQGSPAVREDLRKLKTMVFTPGAPEPQALLSGLHILQHCSLIDRLGELTLPVHFIMGAHDRIVPPDAASAAARLLPDASISVIAGASHLPFISHANECFTELDRHLV